MADREDESKTERKLVACTDVLSGSVLQFKLKEQPNIQFCSFIETSAKQQVVGFFRELLEELEVKRKILDYHLKIRDTRSSFAVAVYYGDLTVNGPVDVLPGHCISCNSDAELFPGELPLIVAGACVLPEFSDQPYVQCHLDAKARPGFIVTPKRHVDRLSELDDEEVYAMWTVAVRALREDSIPFRSMILNHGRYRNIPHLHLKIWVSEGDHLTVRQHWAAEKQELWTKLQILAATLHMKNVACQ